MKQAQNIFLSYFYGYRIRRVKETYYPEPKLFKCNTKIKKKKNTQDQKLDFFQFNFIQKQTQKATQAIKISSTKKKTKKSIKIKFFTLKVYSPQT